MVRKLPGNHTGAFPDMWRLLHTLSRPAIAVLILMSMMSTAWAQLKIEGTRLIYKWSYKEASVKVVNRSGLDTLMQSWVSDSEGGGDVPFAIVQPLTLIPPNGQQMLRVLYSGKGLAEDRESLFWLNILEIPHETEQANTLQLAIRQRLKLFYRPAGLTGSASAAAEGLEWRTRQPGRIEVHNPSGFHVSLIDLQLVSPGQARPLADNVLLHPWESLSFEVPSSMPANSRMTYSEITDIGLQKRHHVVLR